jgi:hypothetical protein
MEKDGAGNSLVRLQTDPVAFNYCRRLKISYIYRPVAVIAINIVSDGSVRFDSGDH